SADLPPRGVPALPTGLRARRPGRAPTAGYGAGPSPPRRRGARSGRRRSGGSRLAPRRRRPSWWFRGRSRPRTAPRSWGTTLRTAEVELELPALVRPSRRAPELEGTELRQVCGELDRHSSLA